MKFRQTIIKGKRKTLHREAKIRTKPQKRKMFQYATIAINSQDDKGVKCLAWSGVPGKLCVGYW